MRVRGLTVLEGMPGLDVALQKIQSLEGRVVDPQGKPVPGASVSLLAGQELRETVRSMADGRFRVGLTMAQGSYRIRATHPRFGDSGFQEIWFPPDRPVQIVLGAGERVRKGRISGTVRDAYGRPLSSAVVRLAGLSGAPLRPPMRTDRSGRFRFDSIHEGSCRLLFSHPAHSSSSGHSIQVELGSEGVARVDFRFRGTESLTGLVLDALSEPVAGAHLVLQNMADSGSSSGQATRSQHLYESISGDDGTFRFQGIEAGSYELQIDTLDRRFQERRVAVRLPEDNELVIDLEPGLVLRALVFDAAGDVLNEVELSIRKASGEGGSFARRYELLEGPLSVNGLDAVEYIVTISTDDGSRYSGSVDLGGGTTVTLQIPEGGDQLIVHHLED